MRVALIVLQLRVDAYATEEALRLGAERAFSRNAGVEWPTNCGFYYFDSHSGRETNRVKRVQFIDIPDGA